MGVQDKYTNSDVVAGKKPRPSSFQGAKAIVMVFPFSVANGDSIGSVLRLAKLPGTLVPLSITVETTAITSASDNDLGLYEPGVGGAVVDKDCLMDGQTLASASRTLNGTAGIALADRGKMLYELAGHTVKTRLPEYDLALTLNAAAAADGTGAVVCVFAQG